MRIDIKGSIISNDNKWIYEYYGMDSVCPRDVQAAIEKAQGTPIDVYINSGGGEIFAGSEIYATLSAYDGDVAIHVVGLAGSAASVIMCAGKSDIASTAMIMAHNVAANAAGDYHDMDDMSEILQKANKAIASAYMRKSGMSEIEALTLMEKETWLTAQQAVEAKLIDKIADAKNIQLVASLSDGAIPYNVICKMMDEKLSRLGNKADFLMHKNKLKLINLEERK